jgi:hypothetical protein
MSNTTNNLLDPTQFSIPEGNFSEPEKVDEVVSAEYTPELLRQDREKLHNNAAHLATSSIGFEGTARLLSVVGRPAEPEIITLTPEVQKLQMINDVVAEMEKEQIDAVMNSQNMFSGILDAWQKSRGVDKREVVHDSYIEEVAQLRERIFENSESRLPGQTWRLYPVHGDWYWTLTRSGETELARIDHFSIENGIMMKTTRFVNQGALEHHAIPLSEQQALVGNAELVMDLIEKHIARPVTPRHRSLDTNS